jgi:hypothetical protein
MHKYILIQKIGTGFTDNIPITWYYLLNTGEQGRVSCFRRIGIQPFKINLHRVTSVYVNDSFKIILDDYLNSYIPESKLITSFMHMCKRFIISDHNKNTYYYVSNSLEDLEYQVNLRLLLGE